MTNEEVIQKVKEEVRLRGLSADTEAEYLKSIRVLLNYYDNRLLCEMAESEIREFLLYLLKIGRSSGTVNIYNSAFRFVFGAVLEKNLYYPMIPRRRIHRELPALVGIWTSARTADMNNHLTTPVETGIVPNVRQLQKNVGLTRKRLIF